MYRYVNIFTTFRVRFRGHCLFVSDAAVRLSFQHANHQQSCLPKRRRKSKSPHRPTSNTGSTPASIPPTTNLSACPSSGTPLCEMRQGQRPPIVPILLSIPPPTPLSKAIRASGREAWCVPIRCVPQVRQCHACAVSRATYCRRFRSITEMNRRIPAVAAAVIIIIRRARAVMEGVGNSNSSSFMAL